MSFLYFGGPQSGVGRHIHQMLDQFCRGFVARKTGLTATSRFLVR
jgi:hypothetical protein